MTSIYHWIPITGKLYARRWWQKWWLYLLEKLRSEQKYEGRTKTPRFVKAAIGVGLSCGVMVGIKWLERIKSDFTRKTNLQNF